MAQVVDRDAGRVPGRAVAVVLIGSGVAATLVALFGASSGGPHAGLGLPDSGSFVTYGVPVIRVLTETAAASTVGLLLLGAFLLPAPQPGSAMPPGVRAVLRWSCRTATLWALGAMLMVPFSVADLFGRQIGDVFTVQHLLDIAPQLPFVAAWYVSALLAGLAAIAAARARSWGGTVAAFGLAVAAVLPVAATGHSATGTTQDVATDSLVVHVVAVALWIGGVIALLALPALRAPTPDAASAVARFSRLALACWVVTAASGTANLLSRVAPAEWFTSAYGLLAMAKVAGLLLLGWAGFLHRRRSLGPMWNGDVRALIQLAAVEVVVMLGTLGLAVALGRTAPPPPADAQPSLIADDIGYDLAGAPTPARLLLDWRVDLLWAGVVVLGVLAWWATRRRLRASGMPWPATRTAAWLGGCAAVALATSSGIGRYAPAEFGVLVLQQVLLAIVAPLLLVLGAPATALVRLRRDPRSTAGAVRALVLATARSRWWRWASAPAVAVPLYVVTSVLAVVSGAFAGVLDLHWGRHLLELQFLLGGLLVFAALLGRRARAGRMTPAGRWAAVLLLVLVHQAAGLMIATSNGLIGADWYSDVSVPWQHDPLADQRRFGSIAWWSGQIPLLILLAGVFARLWRSGAQNPCPGAASTDENPGERVPKLDHAAHRS